MYGKMHVIWKDNSQYRVFTNLWRSIAHDKCEPIDVNKYNCKTTQALDSFWNQRELPSCIALALLD